MRWGSPFRPTPAQLWRSRPSGWLLWSSIATAVVAFGFPLTLFGQQYFGFVELPGQVVGLVALVLTVYFVAAEAAKHPFFRRLEI